MLKANGSVVLCVSQLFFLGNKKKRGESTRGKKSVAVRRVFVLTCASERHQRVTSHIRTRERNENYTIVAKRVVADAEAMPRENNK